MVQVVYVLYCVHITVWGQSCTFAEVTFSVRKAGSRLQAAVIRGYDLVRLTTQYGIYVYSDLL